VTALRRARSAAATLLAIATSLGVAASLAGCPRSSPPSTDAGAPSSGASPSTGSSASSAPASTVSTAEGKALVVNACQSCHTEEMLAQQRLTAAQWTKVVTKMAGWGANLEPAETTTLVTYLAATYGPDAGAWSPASVPLAEATAELEPTPDAPLPAGDVERGRATYQEKCSGCHGPEARGAIGVLLVERPLLYRAADFTKTVRRGRGKMTPIPLADADVADVLAFLRGLRHKPLP